MRSDNQHLAPSASVYCRRRNLLVALDAGVLIACALLAAGAMVAAVFVGPMMTGAAATVLGVTSGERGDERPASALQVRQLDGLRIAPLLALAMTAVVLVA